MPIGGSSLSPSGGSTVSTGGAGVTVSPGQNYYNPGTQVIANQPSQVGIYVPGQPYGSQYRPQNRPTTRRTWNGSTLNQTAPYTVYQELGVVVDVLDASATALAYGFITAIPPNGFSIDLFEITRTKLGGNLYGGLQIAIPPGEWQFLIVTTTASKYLLFSHYGYTN